MAIDYIPYIRSKIGHDRCLSVGLTTLIEDEKGRILLEKRTDNGKYCLPGGSIDLDETVTEGARREVYEETGILLDELHLFYIRSGSKNQMVYPNGDVTDYVDLFFYAKVDSSKVSLSIKDGESTSLKFYAPEEFPPSEEFMRGMEEGIKAYRNRKNGIKVD